MPRPPEVSYKSRDRGPVEFGSKLHEEEGEIMDIAREEVISIPPSLPIKEASEKMVKNEIRRLPVASPGTKMFQGMVVSRDIVDFLGGGEKHQIIKNKHEGNFLSAINDSSKTIMNSEAPRARESSSIPEVAKIMFEGGEGGIPILDKENKLVGIVSERDFANYVPSPAKIRVEPYMAKNIITADPDLFLIEAMKKMISNGFRRLPVVENGTLKGMITSVDVLRYFGTNEMFKNMQSGDALDALSIEVREIMTKEVVTARPQDDLGETAREMAKYGYGGLPVLDNDALVGLITERDMLEILL